MLDLTNHLTPKDGTVDGKAYRYGGGKQVNTTICISFEYWYSVLHEPQMG
jgi:hypothetical protein